jgi:hypothetical protein
VLALYCWKHVLGDGLVKCVVSVNWKTRHRHFGTIQGSYSICIFGDGGGGEIITSVMF